MTPEQINDLLMKKFFTFDDDLVPTDIHYVYKSNREILCRKVNWNPMQNLDQAMMCLEKFEHWSIDTGKCYLTKVCYYNVYIGEPRSEKRVYESSYNNQPLSEVICLAILNAIKEE